jgi:hypothetical protein
MFDISISPYFPFLICAEEEQSWGRKKFLLQEIPSMMPENLFDSPVTRPDLLGHASSPLSL